MHYTALSSGLKDMAIRNHAVGLRGRTDEQYGSARDGEEIGYRDAPEGCSLYTGLLKC